MYFIQAQTAATAATMAPGVSPHLSLLMGNQNMPMTSMGGIRPNMPPNFPNPNMPTNVPGSNFGSSAPGMPSYPNPNMPGGYNQNDPGRHFLPFVCLFFKCSEYFPGSLVSPQPKVYLLENSV